MIYDHRKNEEALNINDLGSIVGEKDPVRNGLFKFFMSFQQNANVLVNDTSQGGTALSLAPHVRKVICYCRNYNQAIVIKERINKKGVHNIYLVVGRMHELPFSNLCFNNICFHKLNITEYSSGDRRESLDFHEIVRSLDILGEFYMNFGKVQVGSFIERIFRIKLKDILKKNAKSGLSKIKNIEYFPNVKKIYLVRQVDNSSFLKQLADLKSNIKIRYLRDNYSAIYMNKSGVSNKYRFPTLLESIMSELRRDIGSDLTQPNLIRLGSAESVVADFGQIIVRLPQTDIGRLRCSNNFDVLSTLKKCELPVVVPKPLKKGFYQGQYYFAETKINGLSLDLHPPNISRKQIISEEVEMFLKSNAMRVGNIDPHSCSILIDEEIRVIIPFLMNDNKNKFLDVAAKIREEFLYNQLPLFIQHGDFKYSNIICDHNSKITGIIDWDLAKIPGLPMVDFITFQHLQENIYKKMNPVHYLHELINEPIKDPKIIRFGEYLQLSHNIISMTAFIALVKYLNDHFYNVEIKQSPQWHNQVIQRYLIPSCEAILNGK